MRRNSVLIYAVVVLSLSLLSVSCGSGSDKPSSGTGTGPLPTGTGPGPTGTGDVGALISAINQERTAAGLGALTHNGSLSSVAQAYADFMAANKRSSYSPNLDGSTPEDRISNAGISFQKAGEAGVVINGDDSWQSALERFRSSFSSVFGDPDFNEIGIGMKYMECTS